MSRSCLTLHNQAEGKQSSTSTAAGEDKFLALQFTSWLAWLQHQSASYKAKWMWSEQTTCRYCSTEADTLCWDNKEEPNNTLLHRARGASSCMEHTQWQMPSVKTHSSPHRLNSWDSKESLNLHRQHKCRTCHISPGHLTVLFFNFLLNKRMAMTQAKSSSSSVSCLWRQPGKLAK